MNIIKLAFDNLWYNKTRTILNMILPEGWDDDDDFNSKH